MDFEGLKSLINRVVAEEDRSCDGAVYMKQLKKLVPNSRDGLQEVFRLCMYQLSHTKAGGRYSLLMFIDQLFSRSAVFREYTAKDFQRFIDLIISPLKLKGIPGSTKDFNLLQSRGLAIIERWNENFGQDFEQIRFGYTFLASNGFKFPRVKERKRKENEAKERELRVVEAKWKQVIQEMDDKKEELGEEIEKINNCLELLVPRFESLFDTRMKRGASEVFPGREIISAKGSEVTFESSSDDSDLDGVEWETAEGKQEEDDDINEMPYQNEKECMDINEIVQAHGLGNSAYQLEIEIPASFHQCRNEDNEVLFQTLEDGIKLVHNQFLPMLTEWDEVLTRVSELKNWPDDFYVYKRNHSVLQGMVKEIVSKWKDLQQKDSILRQRIEKVERKVPVSFRDFENLDGVKKNTGDRATTGSGNEMAAAFVRQRKQTMKRPLPGSKSTSRCKKKSSQVSGTFRKKPGRRWQRNGGL